MADIATSAFKIVQSYGGVKEAYFEVTAATAADVLKFTSAQRVSGIKMVMVQNATTGAMVPCTITGTGDIDITIGAGPSATPLKGIVKYRAY